MVKKEFAKRIAALLMMLVILAQQLPYNVFASSNSENSHVQEQLENVNPEPSPEVSPEPSPEVSPEPSPEVSPEPSPEVSPEPSPEVSPEPSPEVSPEPSPDVPQENGLPEAPKTCVVKFYNDDMALLSSYSDVPYGAKLYTKTEAEALFPDFFIENTYDGSSYFLAKPADSSVPESIVYGPIAISDPLKSGYSFKAWKFLNSGSKYLTINGNTDFVARYKVSNNFVINITYQFSNDGNISAAPSSSFSGSKGSAVSIPLPNPDDPNSAENIKILRGLSPSIHPVSGGESTAASAIESLIVDKIFTVDQAGWDSFLSNCVKAGFLNQNPDGSYEKDEAGTVFIHIPVTYEVKGDISYNISYRIQDLDPTTQKPLKTYTQFLNETKTIKDSNIVSMNVGNISTKFYGYTMNTPSKERAWRSIISADPENPSTIILEYDRNPYEIYFDTQGGVPVEPMEFPNGTDLGIVLKNIETTRSGYTFVGWFLDPECTKPLANTKLTHPKQTVYAKWATGTAKVNIVYWVERPNDVYYANMGSISKYLSTGEVIDLNSLMVTNPVTKADIKAILPEAMTAITSIPVDEHPYFSYDETKTLENNLSKNLVVKNDGSTVVNLYFKRNVYKLVFHLANTGKKPTTARGGESTSTSTTDWNSGFNWHSAPTSGNGNPYLTINGVQVRWPDTYSFSAKYGADISNQWPYDVATLWDRLSTSYFTHWAAQKGSYYFSNGTPFINGKYNVMDKNLMFADGRKEHHFVAIYNWGFLQKEKTYHTIYECNPGEQSSSTPPVVSKTYSEYISNLAEVSNIIDRTKVPVPAGNTPFIETSSYKGTEQLWGSDNPPPPIPGMVLSAMYTDKNGQGTFGTSTDIFSFYTYERYNATFHFQNNKTSPTVITFHHIPSIGRPADDFVFKNRITPPQITPDMNPGYIFGGWFYDTACTKPVNWDTDIIPHGNLPLYAKWDKTPVTVTLTVPDGEISSLSAPDWVNFKDSKGNNVYTNNKVAKGAILPGLAKILRDGPEVSSLDKSFSHWERDDGSRYIYTPENTIEKDLNLTAVWKPNMTGQYTALYLTDEDPGTGLGTRIVDLGDGNKEYFILMEPKTFRGLEVGKTTIATAPDIPGHADYVPRFSTHEVIIEPTIRDDGVKEWPEVPFLYTKFSGKLSYYVHYVQVQRDPKTGLYSDYKNLPPPVNVIRRAPDKKGVITITADQAGEVTESARGIAGFTLIGKNRKTLKLSEDDSRNHLYFYYVPNDQACPYTIKVFFQTESGQYNSNPANSMTIESSGAKNQEIYARDFTVNPHHYVYDPQDLEAFKLKAAGHEYDPSKTPVASMRLTSTEPGKNVLSVYMKRATFAIRYDAGQVDHLDALSWKDADSFLTKDKDSFVWYEQKQWTEKASIPTTSPFHTIYTFQGWRYDGKLYAPDLTASGISKEALPMSELPFYQEGKGLRDNVTLVAEWKLMPVVYYDTRGGKWEDTDKRYIYTDAGQSTVMTHILEDKLAPEPKSPSYISADGIALSFIGWTATNPDVSKPYMDENNRVDREKFKAYAHDFTSEITTSPFTLYAVWDPPVFSFDVLKTGVSGNPLGGASFTLERLRSQVSGDSFVPQQNGGNFVVDSSFAPRTFRTGADGLIHYLFLPAGYYRLTETAYPGGYTPVSEPIIFSFKPGNAYPMIETPVAGVTESVVNGIRRFTVSNTPNYNITISSVDELNFSYTAPKLEWDPNTLTYKMTDPTSQGTWELTSKNSKIEVENKSLIDVPLTLKADLTFEPDYIFLTDLADFKAVRNLHSTFAGDEIIKAKATANGKSVSCPMKINDKVSIFLDFKGKPSQPLPDTLTSVGRISINIIKP